ncbi:MAG: Gar1/Naf1 family protein [Candidatus Bathyarchaeia archaeon]
MRRLGKILHFSKSHSLILKLESKDFPSLNEEVYDSKLKKIGTIFDVFGPTSSPYVSIKPIIPNPENLVGRVAYILNDKF